MVFSYFEKMNSEVPKNTIDMRDCTAVRRFLLPNTIPGKEFAFEFVKQIILKTCVLLFKNKIIFQSVPSI